MPLTRSARCPLAPPALSAAGLDVRRSGSPVRPEGLAYSFTLPGQPRCAAVVRATVRSALTVHGLAPYADPAELVTTELIGTATKLTPGQDLYLSLRYRAGALRIVLWDQHPRHHDPGTVAICEGRRRRSLWLLAAVVDDWGGDWGVAEARLPQRGVRSWVTLRRTGVGSAGSLR
ncbi:MULTISPECIES: ATP-binding protein [unclassified Streptomyces]|uniref:ATP-binding protein n=1 Tax=unclassified Streptomyces TaxID=2593676 RepID=UPI0036292827